jgi:VIT1/CCC1 family predicted Fe2+/Mn2+ transporter
MVVERGQRAQASRREQRVGQKLLDFLCRMDVTKESHRGASRAPTPAVSRRLMAHEEHHYIHRAGWLRAAVLGANDGLISTASLIVGVAAAAADRSEILTAAFAGWAAGAMSMAAGELVSVSSQQDLESADLERERLALKEEPHEELIELTKIYQDRGLDADLARRVAEQLTASDALSAHARDELGLAEGARADAILAAAASAGAFSVGAVLPTLTAFLAPQGTTIAAVSIATLIFLLALGALGAWLGGASVVKPALRVGFWGALAMGVTAGIGALVGKAV